MRTFDFSSFGSVVTTLIGLALFALIGVGIRLVAMMTIQQRRERQNRQINERLKLLMAAYKVLGGSFTGTLTVDPTHRRQLRQRQAEADAPLDLSDDAAEGSDRARRIRDAVEAALSDIILLGTEAQVALAAKAAEELVAGRPVPTAALVVSLRDFIRQALDLTPVPPGVTVPSQGPTRPGGGGNRPGAGGRAGGRGGAGGGGGGGMGMGVVAGRSADD
ncbi:hypothetical protein [Polymorphobacter sp.]|uniref:hypothetical protein n=1 Tax=Polymorphobacter sp. TaxID=1909290 RepID=UPI003F72186C